MSEAEQTESFPTSSPTGAQKLERLREAGVDPFPPEFGEREDIAEVRAAHEGLAPGIETESRHRVAGRIVGRRGHGKACFLDLRDGSGQIQLHAREDLLGEERYEVLVDLDLGDIVGVEGTALRDPPRRRALAGDRPLAPARQEPAAAARQVPRPRGRRDPLPPPRARPDRQRGEPRASSRIRARDGHARCAAGSTSAASSRSRRRSCSRSTAAPWRGRSPPTTTRSTATSTCGSPPSST